ncbi:MAG: AsmA family protein [Rhodospirillales bacterium]|nr:MAG: AsmA family protein [Rhodospirillales bacterium]
MTARRWLWTAAGLALALTLAPVGLYVWASTRDLSRYQNQITEQFRRATGRELSMKGGLRINFTFSPSAVAENVVLANAPGGSRPEMARVKRVVLHLDPFSLLLGEIRVGRIQLSGADILIERDADGRSNVAMEAPVEDSGPHARAHTSHRVKSTPSLPWIGQIEVDGSTLTLRETNDRPTVVIAIDRFVGRASQANSPLSGEFSGRVNGGETLVLTSARAGTFDGWLKGFPGELDIQGALAGGPVTVKGPATARRLEVVVTTAGASLAALGPVLGIPLPETAPYDLRLKVTNAGSRTRVDIEKLQIGASEMLADLRFGADKSGRPTLNATVTSERIDLADFRKRPAPVAPPPAAGGSTPASGAPPPPPAMTLTAPAPAAPADGRVIPADAYPVEAIRRWNVVAAVRVTELVGAAVRVQSLSASIGLNNGKLTFRPAATIGGGQASLDAQVDVSGPGPVLTLTASTARVPVEELTALLGIGVVLKGALVDIEVKLRGPGRNLRESLGLATGTVDFTAGAGEVAAGGAHLLSPEWKRLLNASGRGQVFNCVAGRIELGGRAEGERGAANIRRLVVDAPRFAAAGGGYVQMRNEAVDLVLWPELRDFSLAAASQPLQWKGTLARMSAESNPAAGRGVAIPAKYASLTAALDATGRNRALTGGTVCGTVAARIEALWPHHRARLPVSPAVSPDYRPPRAPARPRR